MLILLYLVKKKLLIGETESIMGIFQQKYQSEQEDTVTSEHDLWTAVLSKAAHDAIYSSNWRESKLAIAWFKGNGQGFKEVCSYAGRDASYIYKNMEEAIAKREQHMEMVRNGGRYYVKETLQLPKQHRSHYRSTNDTKPPGRKRGRPKLYVV